MKLPTERTQPAHSPLTMSALIYGPPKAGKTTFCSGAPKALFAATEAGQSHLSVYVAPITTWTEFLELAGELSRGGHEFETLVVDTIDNAYHLCRLHILAELGLKHESDLGHGKAYGRVADEFRRVLTKLSLLPNLGLWLVGHSAQVEVDTRTGKVQRQVLGISGKSAKFVLGLVDLVLYAEPQTTVGEDGTLTTKTVLRTKPHESYEAGDRTGRLPAELPCDYTAFMAAWTKASSAPKDGMRARMKRPRADETHQDAMGQSWSSSKDSDVDPDDDQVPPY